MVRSLLVLLCGCGRLSFEPVSGVGDDAGADAADGAPDAPAASSCVDGVPGAVLCDGFEAGLQMWSPTTTNGVISRDTQEHLRGIAAVLFQTTAQGGAATFEAPIPPFANFDRLFLRAHVFVKSGPPLANVVMIRARESTQPLVGVLVRAVADEFQVVDAMGDVFPTSVMVPRDRWFCVQLNLVVHDDGVNGVIELRVDSAPLILQSGLVDTSPAGPIETVSFGALTNLNTLSVDVLFDEVAIGTQLISCAL